MSALRHQTRAGAQRRAAIASPHHLATEAGMRAMAAGGSAVDGALAAAAVLTVVYPHNCALGGDLIAILREPAGEAQVINATGPAPAGVDVARIRAGGAMPVVGVDAATVPGLVAGWGALHAAAGRRPWAELLQDALGSARDGVAVTAKLAAAIAEAPGTLQDAGMRAVFAPGGRPLGTGDRLRQPALAETLATLAREGARAFYEGPLASSFVAGLQDLGSAITAADLAAFSAQRDEPLRVDLGDCRLLTAGPNSSGVLLAQALLALRASGMQSPLGREAGRLAAIFAHGGAQRDRELGDPRVVPQDLEGWIGPAAIGRIVAETAAIADGRGAVEPRSPATRPTGDTIAIVATDDEGRAVSLIQSVFYSFGAQVLEPRTGVLLHNRGSGFSLDAEHPNALAPGSRPAHTLMPVVIERDGRLLGVLGTMGGRVQAQIHAQLLLRLLDGVPAAKAVAAPRFAVGAMEAGEGPQTVRVEEDCPSSVADSLRAAGLRPLAVPHHSEDLGHAQAIWCASADGVPDAGSDPRADGSALVA